MKPVYCAGATAALNHARACLARQGVPIADGPLWSTGHLLLDVPSFRPGGSLNKTLDTLLSSLPGDVTVWGGNLEHPALEDYKKVDLLKDEQYLWENAEITAHCALKIAAPLVQAPWAEAPVLIIGWGRIGKHLGRLLKEQGCPLTISARSETDRNAISALGYEAADTAALTGILPRFRLIINTVPAPVLAEGDFDHAGGCIKMDLASQKGIAGEDVIWARGLPGLHAPERSGRLIAETVLRLAKEETP